jgi:hypothetical protein
MNFLIRLLPTSKLQIQPDKHCCCTHHCCFNAYMPAPAITSWSAAAVATQQLVMNE